MIRGKSIIKWLLIIVIVFYIITAPDAAAETVRDIGNALRSVGDSLVTFVRELGA